MVSLVFLLWNISNTIETISGKKTSIMHQLRVKEVNVTQG